MRQKVLSVVGTRPNFMKALPVVAELHARADEFEHVLVHTGQHYDENMTDVFLRQLWGFRPDHELGVGSGTHTRQVARVIERLEPVLHEERPDVVLVPGDVNSTLAAALTSSQLGIPVGHIEAGLRSFDRSMPEELNRILTDQLSELLFTHSPEARDNLLAEGRPDSAIHFVGNTMIDTLVAMRERIDAVDPGAFGVEDGPYLVVTFHRPDLVDGPLLDRAMSHLVALSEHFTLVFPVHPRTRRRLAERNIESTDSRVLLTRPIGYVEFLGLVSSAAGVLTDSGGIQEETTFLGVPCFTLRANTERPITVDLGTNVLLGLEPDRIPEIPALIENTRGRATETPAFWDGSAGARIVDVLAEELPRK